MKASPFNEPKSSQLKISYFYVKTTKLFETKMFAGRFTETVVYLIICMIVCAFHFILRYKCFDKFKFPMKKISCHIPKPVNEVEDSNNYRLLIIPWYELNLRNLKHAQL